MKKKTQGANAHVAGQKPEQFVRELFRGLGARVVTHKSLGYKPIPTLGLWHVLIEHARYHSINGSEGARTEFVYVDPQGKCWRIECKSQGGGGSKDTCLPYFFENVEEAFVEEGAILLLIGVGFTQGARRRAKIRAERAAKTAGKDVRVLESYDEFRTWAMNVFELLDH